MNEVSVAKVLIANRVAINAIPLQMLKRLTNSKADLIPIEVILTSFNGEATTVEGLLY